MSQNPATCSRLHAVRSHSDPAVHEKAPDCPGLGGRRAGACAGSRGLVREPAVVERRKCLLLTHSATLFTIFEADVTASALRATRQLITGLIGRELRREELPAGTFGDLEQQEVLLAKTEDRSVLGCMNDMAFRCEHVIADAGDLARTDLPGLNRSLRRNINSARGYCPPVELAARRLAV